MRQRNLVGMSESAKKRAARRCPGCMECKNEIPQRDYGLRCDSGGVFAKSPEQWRRRFKIGERLRPCPGCERCNPSLDEVRYVQRGDLIALCDGSGICRANRKGSGVLPAGRKS